jgi:hypothetical protein
VEVVNRRDEIETRGAVSVRFSPDGRGVLTVGLEAVLWETATLKERWRLGRREGGLFRAAFTPDGRAVAVGSVTGHVFLIDARTGVALGRVVGHRGTVFALDFAPDGKSLATGGYDTLALVWDTSAAVRDVNPAPADLKPDRLPVLWRELADGDAAGAYKAVWALAGSPKQSVPYLLARLTGGTKEELARVPQLLRALDDRAFRVREAAQAELEALGEPASPAVRKALAGSPSADLRARLQRLLDARPGDAGREQVRRIRALEALELAGGGDARQALRRLAEGAPEAGLRREAEATLRRLEKRADAVP